ncbi:MAG: response regulator transcription factor [Prolixibacteraceae bacterium]|nr:response regulator transcription factor [Prolixibacteraceae bacterium]MBN2649083.1 response regulator transcription factor [Prolixibacteraceae bacterium]
MINIGIYDEHKIMARGLQLILSQVSDFEVVFFTDSKAKLNECIKNRSLHVLVINMHDTSIRNMNLIIQLSLANPKTKLLIVSYDNSEETILKIVKSKAKGFLGRDASQRDLIEAVYTLRNGFDYFNNSINQVVLNQYINDFDKDPGRQSDIDQLSERQLEILKLWGKSYSNQEIADELFISVRTVESHKNHIMQKLKLKSTVDLVKFSIKNNIIEI